ncbi:MAG: zinc ABC transporter solute-binding protein [Gammaproteobacteria bacterium]|nr:zinc ABC transporter solute-binding protein [Gammaproteobacteria bacterium]MCP4881459.1 zinc ABC transporter solute-binding protein [Gammaproteobacteria bacterium]
MLYLPAKLRRSFQSNGSILLSLWLGFAGLVMNTMVYATEQPLQVLSSIKPLALMQTDLGLSWQEPLLPDGITPHDYSLRASHIKRLLQADLVIWMGPELEPYLAKVMSRKPAHQQLIIMPPQGQELELANDGDEHHHHHHHDLHPWTSPEYVRLAMASIVARVSAIETELASGLAQRWRQLEPQLVAQEARWQDYFASHKVGYITYHDALQPYQERMAIDSLGSIADAAGSQGGAKNMQALTKLIMANRVGCILVDAEANRALVKKLSNKRVAEVEIDLLGWTIEPGEKSLLRYFESIGQAIQQCEL